MIASGKYLAYLRNPMDLLRTKKVLQVNPTIEAPRKEPEQTKVFVYDYNAAQVLEKDLEKVPDCYKYLDSPKVSWINIDGLRKADVESIGNHYGIHPLIIEDILSIGQRPKMDEINGVIFCLLYMLYYNEENKTIESEQISIILGKGFVLSFQEDAFKDVFNPLREKIRIPGSKIRQSSADYLFYSLIDMIVDNYFVVMEKFGEGIESLEENIIRRADNLTLSKKNLACVNASDFTDKRVVIKGCGDKAISETAYVEITKKLRPVAKSIMYGEPCSTVPIYKKSRSAQAT